jgi:hypothetical protein
MIDGDDEKPDDQSDESQLDPGLVDAGSRRSVRKRRITAALRDREIQRFWQGVFADPIGRSEIWRLLDDAGTFDQRFGVGPAGFPQPEASWFNMGMRALGLRLFQKWSALAREGVFLMLDEYDPRFARPKMPQVKREK